MLIDTHCHLTDKKFENDRQEAIFRAQKSGVTTLIEIGCETGSWQTALELTKSKDIFCALGIHPQDSNGVTPQTLKILEDLCKGEKVAAIGETGLDYYHDNAPHETQKRVFQNQIELSVKLNKPVKSFEQYLT